jgi:bifunctional non-homologous end joining protein LigD
MLIKCKWHRIPTFPLHMPLRNTKKKGGPSSTSTQKKLRTTLPLPQKSKQKDIQPIIRVDLTRDKVYDWLLEQIKREFQHKKRTPIPKDTRPMLATIKEEAFDDKGWQFEIKWDGYRAIAYVEEGKAELKSRNNLSFRKKYPRLVEALKGWPVNAVVDGEVVILSEDGKADFAALQHWDEQKGGNLLYYVFDLLWLEGIDLQKEPLSTRREILKKILPDSGMIRYSECIDEYGIDFFKAAKDNGLEGIIAKRKDAVYKAGQRSADWVKIKAEKRHEALICGYTKNKDTDRLFSSLVLGIPNGKELQFIGQVGTGFTQDLQATLMGKLRPLTTNLCPFHKVPPIDAFVQWVRPHLVCEVKYTELTKEGVMRHPSFQGMREDKLSTEINLDENEETRGQLLPALPGRNAKNDNNRTVCIGAQELPFTNLSKPYWKKEGITKRDLLNYYYEIAPVMMPYMQNRPQSLNRFPNGIDGESFYQKNMKGKVDKWLTTFERFSEGSEDAKDFLVCTDTASLLYMANLGCIEMNPWHSRIDSPHYPDWCVIDLDPGRISFDKVIQTAVVVKKVFDALAVPSYPKTSGSTGIHIYIPLGARYNYEQSRQLAELAANLVHQELPSFTSLERNPEKRKDKIYLDYLQNRAIQTICAPYSLRPKPGATASAPLHWDEVKKGLKQTQFTIHNMLARVKAEGDLFSGVLGKGIDLNVVLQRLAGML